jgi:hypothetical protein
VQAEACAHIDTVEDVKGPQRRECEDCVRSGSRWLHHAFAEC